MFGNQNWKVKVAYAGFGCLFGSLCTIMGMLASPVTAQRDKFGNIECTSLRIVDGDGETKVALGVGERGGFVGVFDKDGEEWKAALRVGEHGGFVSARGNDGLSGAALSGYEHGGFVVVAGKDGVRNAQLSVNERGGAVRVYGKDGNPKVGLGVTEHGNGSVNTWDKDGNRQ